MANPLKLRAADAEDLSVISACMQPAQRSHTYILG